ncbi:MAG: iron ABC transporter permease [Pseudomonadota bacterium]
MKSAFSQCMTGSVALVTAIPLIAVLHALTVSDQGSSAHLWATVLPDYIRNTALLMTVTGTLAAAIGVGCAWTVTSMDFPGRRILSGALVLPLAAPAYIIAYLYTDLLEYSGPVQTLLRTTFEWNSDDYWFPQIRSLVGAGVMLALVLYPYVYLLAKASFAAQSRSQFLAARTLGLSPMSAFLRIALPAARPAIAGGTALVLMETLADFGVADYFAIPTFSTGIFRTWLAMGDQVGAMKLAGIMLIFVIVLVTLENISRRGHVQSNDRLSDAPPPFTLSPFGSSLAITFCMIPILFGFIIPITVLGWHMTNVGDGQSSLTILGYAQNSLVIASVCAVTATVIALLLAFAQRERTAPKQYRRLRKISIQIATLGYALPGALLALGILGPFGSLDQALTRMSRHLLNSNHGLLLTGSIALLAYALVIRFLTVSFNSVNGGLEKIPPNLEAAARSLGAGTFKTMWRIQTPLLLPSIMTASGLVFIDVMRELPATLILRPFNFETLATRVYRLASDERLAEASTAALIIVLLGIIPVILLNRAKL